MRKNPSIIHKPEPFILRTQEKLELSFIRAITSKNLDLLDVLLCDYGRYFGFPCKFMARRYFMKQFYDWKENDGQITFVERHIALGEDLGKKAFCFEQGRFPSQLLTDHPIALTLQMNHSHITAIDSCYSFIPEAEFLRRAREN